MKKWILCLALVVSMVFLCQAQESNLWQDNIDLVFIDDYSNIITFAMVEKREGVNDGVCVMNFNNRFKSSAIEYYWLTKKSFENGVIKFRKQEGEDKDIGMVIFKDYVPIYCFPYDDGWFSLEGKIRGIER